ncbi:MAG TPA: phage tail assembly protein [Azonexus sp.]|nr:phage tail assembly protein [Azonexus sp.]
MSDSDITIPLSKPLKAHGEEISQIVLREPTSEDIIELGEPRLYIPSQDGVNTGIEIRMPVVARYIMRLGSIPMNSVKALPRADLSRCTAAVMHFFGDGDGETKSDSPPGSSMSPISGG